MFALRDRTSGEPSFGANVKLFFMAFFLVGAFASPVAYGAGLRQYRWRPTVWKPLPYLFTAAIDTAVNGADKDAPPATVGLGGFVRGQELLRAKGEVIETGVQMLGPAVVEGTWTQTVFRADGHVIYAAGAVLDDLPKQQMLSRVMEMQLATPEAIRIARESSREFASSLHRRKPEIRIRQKANGGDWEAYWHFEFLGPAEDRLYFLDLSESKAIIARGDLRPPSVDGMGLVYPKGPKLSALTEVPLVGLLGDGSLNGNRIRIESALGLSVMIPDLKFFFPAEDRRLDLAQVYFTSAEALAWMKQKLGVELRQPLTFRLHIGEGGVSNAAFYDRNVIYLGTGDGVRYKDLPRDPSVVLHECIHAFIDAYAGLPSEGEGGSFNEGFADLFAALILQNPRLGESSYIQGPYRRTLENDLKAYVDFRPGVYQNGTIVAGTFWDMRKVLNDDKLATLAFRTLTRLGKGAKFSDFLPALTGAASTLLNAEEQAAVMSVAQSRGWVSIQ
jgi:hypothetical protein